MPFAATSYGLGLTEIDNRQFLLGTLASLPALFGYVATGTFTPAGWATTQNDTGLLQGVMLALGLAATIFTGLRVQRMLRASLTSDPATGAAIGMVAEQFMVTGIVGQDLERLVPADLRHLDTVAPCRTASVKGRHSMRAPQRALDIARGCSPRLDDQRHAAMLIGVAVIRSWGVRLRNTGPSPNPAQAIHANGNALGRIDGPQAQRSGLRLPSVSDLRTMINSLSGMIPMSFISSATVRIAATPQPCRS